MSASNMPSSILGIHHLKILVFPFEQSLQFYEKVFNVKQIPGLDHIKEDGTIFPHILSVPAWQGHIELRLDAQTAQETKGLNVIWLALDNLER